MIKFSRNIKYSLIFCLLLIPSMLMAYGASDIDDVTAKNFYYDGSNKIIGTVNGEEITFTPRTTFNSANNESYGLGTGDYFGRPAKTSKYYKSFIYAIELSLTATCNNNYTGTGLAGGDIKSPRLMVFSNNAYVTKAFNGEAGCITIAKEKPKAATASTTSSPATTTFRLFPDIKCTTDTLTCWVEAVFSWSQTAILLLATVVIVFAGLTYMTSAGNEKQIALSKRLILGALSGVAVVVLGRFFLTVVIGVPWL